MCSGYDPDISRAFGAFIRDGRISKKISQQDLAKSLGITQPYLSRLEQGLRSIDLDQAITICTTLDLDLNKFILKIRELQRHHKEEDQLP